MRYMGVIEENSASFGSDPSGYSVCIAAGMSSQATLPLIQEV